MNAKVFEDKCIGCGQCVAICPEVFDINEDGLATVIVGEITDEVLESASMAAESCPTEAIEITEENIQTTEN